MRIIALRFIDGIQLVPTRAGRLLRHLRQGFFIITKHKVRPSTQWWWAELFFLVMDFLLLPEFYETGMDLAKWKTRSLTENEKRLARSVFGDAIHLERVRVDERARLGCKSHQIIYVSFYTINAWGPFRPHLLIHELVHVWQFQKMGSAYIPRALMAQRTEAHYNYGGVPALQQCIARAGKLEDFNLEQQAEIIADYYCIREKMKPTWGQGTEKDLPAYEYFLKELSEK